MLLRQWYEVQEVLWQAWRRGLTAIAALAGPARVGKAAGAHYGARMKFLTALLLFVFAATSSCSKHPLDGGWTEHTQGAPRVLEFDAASDKVFVHAHGRTDGGSEHLNGTYTLTGTELSVAWEDGGKKLSFTGKLVGEHLELTDPAGSKVEFHHGGQAH